MIAQSILRPARQTLQGWFMVVLLLGLLSLSPQTYGGARSLNTGTTTEWVNHQSRLRKQVNYFHPESTFSSYDHGSFCDVLRTNAHRYRIGFLLQEKVFRTIKVNWLMRFTILSRSKSEEHLAPPPT